MRKRKTISKPCERCEKMFDAGLAEIKRGLAKYCSLRCSARRPPLIRSPNVNCDFCLTSFYKCPSRLKELRSFHFCSRSCQNQAQKSTSGPKFQALRRRKDGSSSYRALAFSVYPKVCMECGYDKTPEILIVHHRDRNRSNNEADNLKVVCPNCHDEDHFAARDGRFSFSAPVSLAV